MIALMALTLGLLAGGPAEANTGASASPSIQALIHYNARMALRDGQPTEALKLWLLRNATEQKTEQVSAQDEDLRAVTWAALGDLGLCPDGFPADRAVGLWPLATHNWLVFNMRRAEPSDLPNPFGAFRIGRQQRFVSLFDVLDADELRMVRFRRAICWQHLMLLYETNESLLTPINDKRTNGRLMRHLLRRSLRTLNRQHVVGRALIQARIFDLNLKLTGLGRKAARRARRKARRAGLEQGLSKAEIAEQAVPIVEIAEDSEEARILDESLTWPAEEWLSLSSDRRQFLFAQAIRRIKAPDQVNGLMLDIIDALIAQKRGAEVQSWMAHYTRAGVSDQTRQDLWAGDRGQRLMTLDRESGFRERGVIALHRGVDQLARGELDTALRSLAYALRWAETSRKAEPVRSLARRWLSYVAAQYRVTDELFVLLRSLVPRTDYNSVLEDQLWTAALGADQGSFDRCVRHQAGRGALEQRIEVLRPLAAGDADAFVAGLNARLDESPFFTYRFLSQFMGRLQVQPVAIRTQYISTARKVQNRLETEVARAAAEGKRIRQAETLIIELRALIEGLTGFEGASESDRAFALSPDHEVYAGSVRIAPGDTLPWPFQVAEVEAPPVFTAITLKPEEWRAPDGGLIFGWRISE